MKFLGGLSGGGLGGAALGAAGAAAIAVGGFVGWKAMQEPAPKTPSALLEPQEPAQDTGPVAVPAGASEPAETAETPEAVPAPAPPRFDLVRVEADGSAVIAGLAAPGAKVHVLLDGQDAAVVEADASGNFVALMQIGLSAAPRVVTLLAEDGTGATLASDDSAIIQPVVQVAEAEIATTAENSPVSQPPVSQPPVQQPASPADPVAGADAAPVAETASDPAAGSQTPPDQTPPDQTPPEQVAEVQTPPAAVSGVEPEQEADAAPQVPDSPIVPDEASTPAPQVAAPADVPSAPQNVPGDTPDETRVAPPVSPPVEIATATQNATETDAPAPDASDTADSATPSAETTAPEIAEAAEAPTLAPQPQAMAMQPIQPDVVGETSAAATAMAEPAPVPTPAPPRVMIASSEGITIVQPGGQGLAVQQDVTLDAITYDPAGDVLLSGRGSGNTAVRVYLDNRPILTTTIAENGQWRTGLPEVESGVYTLRVDQLDAQGAVTSRIETPFKREDADQLASVAADVAADVAASSGETAPRVRAITVQPDTTLWQIATENYGDGMLYVRVFEANRDQIRDPHWIYPGQVFTLPQ